jgi:hypothetical protein
MVKNQPKTARHIIDFGCIGYKTQTLLGILPQSLKKALTWAIKAEICVKNVNNAINSFITRKLEARWIVSKLGQTCCKKRYF